MKRVFSTYRRVLWTYARWAPTLIVLATIVFVPLGLVHAITIHAEIGSLDIESGLRVFAAATAIAALVATGLLGEVFYTGAVAISLTHPHGDRPPSLREIARTIKYRQLIAIDLLYGAIVAIGLVLLVAPGVAAFVWFGLAAPVVEIERRGVRAAFARSVQLVHRSFWVVLAVLVPIEILGSTLTGLTTALAHDLLGETLLSKWLADTLANVAFTPFYAVAAVLLTVDLIHRTEGAGPALHSKPVRA